MAEDPRGRRIIYMSVLAGYNLLNPDYSFEEHRIADYIQAYTTTGRPPAPCPLEPRDPSARITLGLPPLFQPYTEVERQSTSTSSSNGPQIPEPAAVAQDSEEVLLSITCTEEYARHSFEELRWLAYTHRPQANVVTYAVEGSDAFQTISCAPEHSGFSLEELRLAHIRTPGRPNP